MSEQFVYCIQAGDDGPFKIGVAASPEWRCSQLQIGNHLPLRLLKTVSGGVELERRLHRELAQWRIRGEWFENVPEVKAAIWAALMEPGRHNALRGERAYWACENCGAKDIGRHTDDWLCKACHEFADVRERAAQGIDPFEEAA